MRTLTEHDAWKLVQEHELVVIHLDASWDGYAALMRKQLEHLERELDGDVAFGYLDVDDHQGFARDVKVGNVPSVAYFRGGCLIAVVIGLRQDVEANIRLVKNGEVPETSNRLSRM